MQQDAPRRRPKGISVGAQGRSLICLGK